MKTSLIMLIFISFSAFAETRTVIGRTANGRLILTTGCSEIQRDVTAVSEWTTALERRNCQAPAIQESGEGMCTADVTSCVPEHVRRYQNLTAGDNGPNCWNLALVMGGLVPMLRESSPEEWEHHLSSPLCRELAEGEAPRPGDLGSIEARGTDGRKNHQHGFMYVSPTLVYSKNGTLLTSPYALQEREAMESTYRVGLLPDGECSSDCAPRPLVDFLSEAQVTAFPRGVPGPEICHLDLSLPSPLSEACAEMKATLEGNLPRCGACNRSSVHYYRCQRFEDYVAAQSLGGRPDFTSIDRQIRGLEGCAQASLFSANGQTPMLNFVATNLNVLNAYLQSNPPASERNPAERYVLTSFALRLQGLRSVFGNQTSSSELGRLFESAIEELSIVQK